MLQSEPGFVSSSETNVVIGRYNYGHVDGATI